MSDIPESIDVFLSRANKPQDCRHDCFYEGGNQNWLLAEDYNRSSVKQRQQFVKVYFVLQKSPSAAARCRHCGESIRKESLRLGFPLKDTRGVYGVLTGWMHIRCSHNLLNEVFKKVNEESLIKQYTSFCEDNEPLPNDAFWGEQVVEDEKKKKRKESVSGAKPTRQSSLKKEKRANIQKDDEMDNIEKKSASEVKEFTEKAEFDAEILSFLQKIPVSLVITAANMFYDWELATPQQKALLIHFLFFSPTEKCISNDATQMYLDSLVKRPVAMKQPSPDDLQTNLLPFQEEGLAWMCSQEQSDIRGGILADEMGMGKTIQTIALLLTKKSEDLLRRSSTDTVVSDTETFVPRGIGATLIVAPIAAVMQWKQEIEKFTKPGSLRVTIYHGSYREALLNKIHDFDVVITTYATVESDYRRIINTYKVACEYCGRLFLPDKLRFHQQYFCGPTAVQTARQAKTKKTVKVATKKAMKTLNIGTNDTDALTQKYQVPSVGNVYRAILKEADASLAEKLSRQVSWIFPRNRIKAESDRIFDRASSQKGSGSKIDKVSKPSVKSCPLENTVTDLDGVPDLYFRAFCQLLSMGYDVERSRAAIIDSKGDIGEAIQLMKPNSPINDTIVKLEEKRNLSVDPEKNDSGEVDCETVQQRRKKMIGLSASEIKKQKVTELREMLKKIDHPTYGTRNELVNRLLLAVYPEHGPSINSSPLGQNTSVNRNPYFGTCTMRIGDIRENTRTGNGTTKKTRKGDASSMIRNNSMQKKVQWDNSKDTTKVKDHSKVHEEDKIIIRGKDLTMKPKKRSRLFEETEMIKQEVVEEMSAPSSKKNSQPLQTKSRDRTLIRVSDSVGNSKNDNKNSISGTSNGIDEKSHSPDTSPCSKVTLPSTEQSIPWISLMEMNETLSKCKGSESLVDNNLMATHDTLENDSFEASNKFAKLSHAVSKEQRQKQAYVNARPMRQCRFLKKSLCSLPKVSSTTFEFSDLSDDSGKDSTLSLGDFDSCGTKISTSQELSSFEGSDRDGDDCLRDSYCEDSDTSSSATSSVDMPSFMKNKPRINRRHSPLSPHNSRDYQQLSTSDQSLKSSPSQNNNKEDDEFGIDAVSLKLSPLHSIKWIRIVLDEAHRIKSRDTSTAKAINSLSSRYSRWCLTGTPLQNRVGELYSLIRFLRLEPYAFYYCRKKGCSCKSLYYRFPDNRFCLLCNHAKTQHFSYFNKSIVNPIKKYGYQHQGQAGLKLLKKDILDRILLRRTKKERAADINLPSLTILIRRDQLEPAERDFYESLYKQTRIQFNTYVDEGTLLHNYAHIFDLLSRLRQAVDHPYLIVYGSLATRDTLIPAPARGNCDVCGVCQDDIEEGYMISSGCKHTFHKECIEDYVSMAPQSIGSFIANHTLNCEELNVSKMHVNNENTVNMDHYKPFGESPLGCPVCYEPLTINLSSHFLASERDGVEGREFIRKKNTGILSKIRTSQFQSSTKIEALIQELQNVFKQDEMAKCIVFSQFTSMLEIIEWRLKKGGMNCVKLTGSLSMTARSNMLYSFNKENKLRILLISLKAGGEGLNLQVANNIFLMDPWWNPAAELQAIQRAHRIGQTKNVRAVRFICENTIEEKMLQLQEKKQLVFDGHSELKCLNGVKTGFLKPERVSHILNTSMRTLVGTDD